LFHNKSITSIHIWGMLVMLLFIALFIVLVIHEEYSDFDKEISNIREKYIKKQKESIKFDTNRVLDFINYEYHSRDAIVDRDLLKKQTISAIEHLYSRQDGTGYIFIYSTEGVKLSDPVQSENIGKNMYHFRDSDGIQVIKELISVSQKDNGGFVRYRWMKPTTGVLTPKISYAKSFKPWGWMVGTGVYLDEVEKLIKAERLALKERLIKYMMVILSLAVILSGLGFILVTIVNRIISREIDTFSQFFKKSSKSYTTIDVDDIHLCEFKKMVKYINRMVKEIHQRKDKLKEMNLSLEKKVKEKTEDIREQNHLLEREKLYSDSLVKAQDSFIKHSIHEVNTPLAVIMTHIDIYKIKYGENRYLSKIEAASKMISNIYDDLSYMVKKDRLTYDKEWIDFSRFLYDRVQFFEEIAIGNQHKIIIDIESGIDIYFNDMELQRVVDNNLSNAIKFAKKGSDIVVFLKKSDDIVLKFVTNSKKITDTKKIFEPYHRESSTEIGFGLGLEIVGQICDKNSVLISVESDSDMTQFIYRFMPL